jgi:flagellar motor switch protein FliN
MSISRQLWIDRFAAQLAIVIGALVEAGASVASSDTAPTGGWVAILRAEGAARGSLSIHFDEASLEGLTKRVMALDATPAASTVVDTLNEICGQAAAVLTQEPPFIGVTLQVVSVSAAPTGTAADDGVMMAIAVDKSDPLRLSFWGDIAASTVMPRSGQGNDSAPGANPKLDVILDIDLPLVVRFGRTEMPLSALAALGPGSVIDLGRPPDEFVDVMVSGQVVARGEVVIVGGNYGVRITDVISPASRALSTEVSL